MNKVNVKKWWVGLSLNQKILMCCGVAAVVLMLISLLTTRLSELERLVPVATREDFIGKTFTEAKRLADERGIRYDIDNFTGIYDWESEDTQIMNWVTTVYDENDNRVDYNRYTSHGFELYAGWRISMGTDVKTEQQEKDEEACKAKAGYTYTYKDGKVDCHKTQETLCVEAGKVWYKGLCKTQDEVDEAERKATEEKAKESGSAAGGEQQEAPQVTPQQVAPAFVAEGTFNGHLKFQVKNVERNVDSKEGREAIKVNFVVTNVSGQELTYYAYHDVRYRTSDSKYERTSDYYYNDKGEISGGRLQPGETRSGYRKFWVKTGAYALRFCYDPSAGESAFCLDV